MRKIKNLHLKFPEESKVYNFNEKEEILMNLLTLNWVVGCSGAEEEQ